MYVNSADKNSFKNIENVLYTNYRHYAYTVQYFSLINRFTKTYIHNRINNQTHTLLIVIHKYFTMVKISTYF